MVRISTFPLLLLVTLLLGPSLLAGEEEERLLNLLKKAAEEEAASRINFTDAVAKEDTRAARKINQKLDKRKIHLDVDDVELLTVVDLLRDVTDLNIVVTKKVRDWVEEENPTVTMRLRKITIRNALELMLTSLHEDLAYGIRHGALLLGFRKTFQKKTVVRVYDVADLVHDPPDFPAPRLQLGLIEEED